MHDLYALGWNEHFARQLDEGALTGDAESGAVFPARVSEEHRDGYRLLAARGELRASCAGRVWHEAARGGARPATGDWVLAAPAGEGQAVIQRVLDRRTSLTRKVAGERTAEQVVAANVDVVFVVQSMNGNLNPRRLERALALVWESGAEPVVLLNKADLCAEPVPSVAVAEAAAPGVPVHAVSAILPDGLTPLAGYLRPGRTCALIGSSGVGKSTIVNALLGEERLAVSAIREDDRGRHTTTARQVVVLPGGGLLLDTPGMRTMLLVEAEDGLARAFADIEELAARCRFADCGHDSEPGCAVHAALASGALDPARYQSYLKLEREMQYAARKQDVALRIAQTKRWKRIHRELRARPDKRRL